MAENTGGSKNIIIIVVVLIVLAVIAYAMGLFNVDASGEVEMPDVDISATGGELPEVQVETADIDVEGGDIDMDVDLPSVSVDGADDDGSANQ